MANENYNSFSRRHFLGTSLLGAAGITLLPNLSFGSNAPSDRIRLGFIGVGRQSLGLARNLMKFPNVEVVAGCDVYGLKRLRFEMMVKDHYSSQKKKVKFKSYEDYHDLLAQKEIDAVVIASPDHWHALMAIDACKAGKDIYLEKPLTFTIKEGQELVKAVRKHNRILAVGSQQRSHVYFKHAVDLIHSGKIGKLQRINARVGAPPVPYDLPEEQVPAGLNWDKWLGPSSYIHYNSQLAPPISLSPVVNEQTWAGWRLFKETGGGMTTDWGAHMFDIAQWAADKDGSGPVEIIPPGYQDYDYLTYRYDNGVIMTERPWNEKKDQGIKFWGSDGWIEVTRGMFNASDPSLLINQDISGHHPSHMENFIASIRNRKDPVVTVEIGHRTCTVCTLGNIAYELGRPLQWNPEKETFVNDPEANKHLHREYREGYKLG
jgi:predicted dehydrogenase